MSVGKRGKVDAQQAAIVACLRDLGVSVAVTSSLGGGFPDLVVGHQGKNYLFEVKGLGRRKPLDLLTPQEKIFFTEWTGQVHAISTIGDILRVLQWER